MSWGDMLPLPESPVPYMGSISQTECQLECHSNLSPIPAVGLSIFKLLWRTLRLQSNTLVQQYGMLDCTPLALDLHRDPRLAPFPHYFKNCQILPSLRFKFKGQQNTLKCKAIIPGSLDSPPISKQSWAQVIERPISTGCKSMKEGSPEPAHNSWPVGELSYSLTDRFLPWGQLAQKEATTVML